jgi:short-subunit dehydrogenase
MTTAAEMRGRTALVTGASRGIGRAIAEQLGGNGADVVLVGRNEAALAEAAQSVRARGGSARTITLDLADPAAPRKLAEQVGEVELLVNNAGAVFGGTFAEAEPAELRTMLDLNIGALTELTGLFLPGMLARGHGAVLNIASTGAYVPSPGLAAYSASKAYVVSLSRALWSEARKSGVRVVAVSPGPTKTAMNPRGVRTADQVAQTALAALAGAGPTVIDGRLNALSSHLFARLLPGGAAASVAGWLVNRMAA